MRERPPGQISQDRWRRWLSTKECIDYVILHELCHMKEHHHGPAFYRLLDQVLPDWRVRREKLNACEVA